MVEWFRIYIKKIGFNYVMRTKEDISVECEDFNGKIKDIKTITGIIYELRDGVWPKLVKKSKEKRKNRIKSRFIITKKKREDYGVFLMLNSEGSELPANWVIN